MPYYDSALQVSQAYKEGMRGIRPTVLKVTRAHAVKRPEQGSRASKTLCGLSIADMEYREAHTPDMWPPARYRDEACGACRAHMH
jgi:hypothetical protein